MRRIASARRKQDLPELFFRFVVASARDIHNAMQETPMLGWSLFFLTISLIAGAVAFGGLASGTVGLAPMLFMGFLVLSLVTAIVSYLRP